jgi:polyferredoxin
LTADLGTCSTTSVLNLSSKRYMMSVLFCILLLLNSFSRSISLYNCPSPRFASLALDFDWYRVLPSISAG